VYDERVVQIRKEAEPINVAHLLQLRQRAALQSSGQRHVGREDLRGAHGGVVHGRAVGRHEGVGQAQRLRLQRARQRLGCIYTDMCIDIYMC
jgi:hypothetical protein